MRIRFVNRNESLDQRVKRLEFANNALIISVLLLAICFSIYSFRMWFVIDAIIGNIDGIIATISDISDQIQSIDKSFKEVSGILTELGRVLSELKGLFGF